MKYEKKKVLHLNFIGHEINESLQKYDDEDREIYCRRHNKVWVPTEKACEKCGYLQTWMQGMGLGCEWEDYVPEDAEPFVEVPHKNRRKEMLRVKTLIDKKKLEKLDR